MKLYSDTQTREFNRYTLTGQYDLFFFSLLRERLSEDRPDTEAFLEPQFKAHLSRGVGLLHQRLKNMENITALITGMGHREQLDGGITE